MAQILTDDSQQQVDPDELARRQRSIGKIIGPPESAAHQAAITPIGKPLAPPSVTPGPDNGSHFPPEMMLKPPAGGLVGTPPDMPAPQAPSSIGAPISGGPERPTPNEHSSDPNERLTALQEKGTPQFTGLRRVADTLAGMTSIGTAIERAGGIGTQGYREKLGEAEHQVGEQNKVAQEQASPGKTQAESEELKAKGDAEIAASEKVTITDPKTGHTFETTAKAAPALYKQLLANESAEARNTETVTGRENVASTGAQSRTDVATINAGSKVKSLEQQYDEAIKSGDTEGAKKILTEAGAFSAAKENPPQTLMTVPNDPNDPSKGSHAIDVRPGSQVPTGAQIPSQVGSPSNTNAERSANESMQYAIEYQKAQHTGPGDEALMEQFFNVAKPSTGFRMNQSQMNMLLKSRSWMDSAEGTAYHAANGVWFPDEQRDQIIETMKLLAKSKGIGGQSKPGGGQGGAGASSTPPPGAKIVPLYEFLRAK